MCRPIFKEKDKTANSKKTAALTTGMQREQQLINSLSSSLCPVAAALTDLAAVLGDFHLGQPAVSTPTPPAPHTVTISPRTEDGTVL